MILFIFIKLKSYSLKQSFGLAGRIIRAEVLILINFLFNGKELTLEFVPQAWQRISDVIGQLLHQNVRQLKTKEKNLTELVHACLDPGLCSSPFPHILD